MKSKLHGLQQYYLNPQRGTEIAGKIKLCKERGGEGKAPDRTVWEAEDKDLWNHLYNALLQCLWDLFKLIVYFIYCGKILSPPLFH